MFLDGYLGPWSGKALRHFPDMPAIDPMNFDNCGKSAENRWNVPGERTLYLASSKAVALGEFARHLDEARSPGMRAGMRPRIVFSFSLSFSSALDLRDPLVCGELGLDPMTLMQDRPKARALAQFVRTLTEAQALLVPSMAFLDEMARHWNIVVFLEKLAPDPRACISAPTADGRFEIK